MPTRPATTGSRVTSSRVSESCSLTGCGCDDIGLRGLGGLQAANDRRQRRLALLELPLEAGRLGAVDLALQAAELVTQDSQQEVALRRGEGHFHASRSASGGPALYRWLGATPPTMAACRSATSRRHTRSPWVRSPRSARQAGGRSSHRYSRPTIGRGSSGPLAM